MGWEGLDHADLQRAYFGPCVEDSEETHEARIRRLIDRALGGDWPALALHHLVVNNEVDFSDADAAYRKVFGYGIDSGVINDRADKAECDARYHPFRSVLMGVVR